MIRARSFLFGCLFCIGLCFPAVSGSYAHNALNAEAVRQTLGDFQDALNLAHGSVAALRFLNGHINDRALIRFSDKGTMDKESFVNGALFGTKTFDDYEITLDPVAIIIDNEGVHADVSEKVTERGAPALGLVSTKTWRCDSRFALATDGSLVMSARACEALPPSGDSGF